MREIALDTETTGMDPAQGDRIVEIGCVELDNHVPTGRTYHVHVNPKRDVPAEAEAVHGLSTKFLSTKPVFAALYTEMLDFIGDSRLVIHNAEFDIKFLNAELRRVGHAGFKLPDVIDTLKIARQKFPGSPANLDALCRRFGIDNSAREFHGALLDAQLLSEVYLEMMGGRQHGLGLVADQKDDSPVSLLMSQADLSSTVTRERRHFPVSEEERNAHAKMVESLTDPIWKERA